MSVYQKNFEIKTSKQFEIVDITSSVQKTVAEAKIKTGIVSITSPHTTASIRVNHLEPLLLQDIMKLMYRLAPLESSYAHDFFEIRTEMQAIERSNGHAHVKAFLTGSSETLPISQGKAALGFRQSVFFVEFDGGRSRHYTVTVVGE